MCLEHCWNVIATISIMRGKELVWGAGECVMGSQNEQSYQWCSSGMHLETNAIQFFHYSPGYRMWSKLKRSVSGTGSLILRMEHHSSERSGGPIRETETEGIAEAESAKPWAWTHDQGPCVRSSREERGNVEWWLKICEHQCHTAGIQSQGLWKAGSNVCGSPRWSFSNLTLLHFYDVSIQACSAIKKEDLVQL